LKEPQPEAAKCPRFRDSPKCTQEESIAIGELLTTCPAELRQKALDEIEGARQAGVIKTNLVPFARGIMTAISRGTFSIGHGTRVHTQRMNQAIRERNVHSGGCYKDPISQAKGAALMDKIKKTMGQS